MSANNLFLKSGYIKAPLANGLGRVMLQCQRVTIKFCKSHGDSRGVREFIENDLIDFARDNPSVVTYLKPRRHRSPILVAEYLNGHREWLTLSRMKREEVAKWLEVVRTGGGQGEIKYKQYYRTDNPSIQGVWTPFTHKEAEKNLAEFPNEEYARPALQRKSATEILQQMAAETQNVVLQEENR